AGVTLPTAERLQALIRALLEARGLTPGRETSEARELWTAVVQEAPRMKTPFDHEWFAGLLGARPDRPSTSAPASHDGLHPFAAQEPATGAGERAADWGEAPDAKRLIG